MSEEEENVTHDSHRRVFIILLDSVGCGALPDAEQYGDVGANTIAHVAQHNGGLNMPTMQKLGLGNLTDIAGVPPTDTPLAVVDKLATKSRGKDTITGHWELMGVVSEQAFPLYPEGFPLEIMNLFTEKTGHGWLGNYPASGTDIICELGPEHIATGKPIVYTSGDSVFQIAAHNGVIPLEELYRICQITRDEVMVEPHAVSRIIARPFIGNATDGFTRTADRHDYALSPHYESTLERLQKQNIPTLCIGKINDIFNGIGVSEKWPTHSNEEGMQMIEKAAAIATGGLIFTNLVDFDMLWGHRRDYKSYGAGLEAFDMWLATFLPQLRPNDLLLITADHGCDPLHTGTDHTREYVPLLTYSPMPGVAQHYNDQATSECCKTKIKHDHYLYKVAKIVEDYLVNTPNKKLLEE